MELVPSILVGLAALFVLVAHVAAVELAVAGQRRLDGVVPEGGRGQAGRRTVGGRYRRRQLQQGDVITAIGAVAPATQVGFGVADHTANDGGKVVLFVLTNLFWGAVILKCFLNFLDSMRDK